MAATSKPLKTARRWPAWIMYFAFLLGLLVLLLMAGSGSQDNAIDLEARNLVRPPETNYSVAPTTAPDRNTAASYSAPTPLVPGQPDPFRVFLEKHGDAQLSPVNARPVQQDPQTIQDTFKEAIKRQHDVSTASPFATVRNPDN